MGTPRISIANWISSHDLDQRDPDPNKKTVLRLYKRLNPAEFLIPYAAPKRNGGWAIWRSADRILAEGKTSQEAWRSALRKLERQMYVPKRKPPTSVKYLAEVY
jgi:hypothetical protein